MCLKSSARNCGNTQVGVRGGLCAAGAAVAARAGRGAAVGPRAGDGALHARRARDGRLSILRSAGL